MLNQGPIPLTAPDFSKYSKEEAQKFNAILEAQNDYAQLLYNCLSSSEEAKLEQYIADLQQFEDFKNYTKEMFEYHHGEIDSSRIDHTPAGKEIIRQHKSQVVDSKPKSNDHTNGHAVTSGKKVKKRNNCTLI